MEPTLCNTSTSLASALDALRASDILILDCEGDNLGKQGGTLSIITLHIPSSNQTYLIDVLRLSSADLRPVYHLLESPSVTKIVFDGRMDYSALYHEKAVDMQNVLDMQIADVRSRIVRGEDQEDQFSRLKGFLHWPEIIGQPDSYRKVQRLNGLKACAKEHEVEVDGLTDVMVTHSAWMARPLPEQYIQYAITDARLIDILYDEFKRCGYIDGVLSQQSMRYITLWKSRQPRMQDTHLAHPLLPLGVLENPEYYICRTCNTCQRELSQDDFSKTGWRIAQKRVCWVCLAVTKRENMQRDWDREAYDYHSDDVGFESWRSEGEFGYDDWDSD
ncbi:hypothetical protein VNI00_006394 [Paramarasmius palmivorus]|uniref:3'-5' exonuclease domain-containing protein n=1 Tax=Paramarasmius palmivorus TaxID=297713 RepID=A0AAW0D8S6_9AGAR